MPNLLRSGRQLFPPRSFLHNRTQVASCPSRLLLAMASSIRPNAGARAGTLAWAG
ncbi:hypothetical protein DACRYDRAFT_25495 [Dacryopinax primogenitus]|uniref:Uncharacterized protein n=1 Tax=Dacryopinax primogenitus (strain DJM 731) TaxID=1858805 RepID=M5FUA9_DACPD|nr:uncharacterized protein DACRYDRAFT_25495 [Dacryopinax primogenitus]EJT96821.1 hypothetical protein DACRYDRAFT_25495 [Dacryopinax primogenitus]